MVGVQQSGEHTGLDRGFFVVCGEEIFMDGKCKFAQSIHGFMGVFVDVNVVFSKKNSVGKTTLLLYPAKN